MSSVKLFVGNWKMNKTVKEALSFLDQFKPLVENSKQSIWIAPAFTAIYAMNKNCGNIVIGAQDLHEENSGAFTGEISGEMIKEAGAQFVILGHSERRGIYQETSTLVNKKVKNALSINLTPILCIGETLDDREGGEFKDVLEKMLEESLADIDHHQMDKIILAYEPVWAIGTGVVATPEQAEEVHHFIREWLTDNYSESLARSTKIIYGGSVKPDNIQSLLQNPDIDGVLVGGASLNAETFASIINSVDSK